MEYGFAMDMKTIIQDYHETYSDLITGYYLDQPPADLSDRRVFGHYTKNKNIKSHKQSCHFDSRIGMECQIVSTSKL